MLWTATKGAFRAVHYIMKMGVSILPFPVPELISGAGSLHQLADKVKTAGISKIMLVTDPGIVKIGLVKELENSLKENDVQYILFDGVQPNPTIQNIEDGLKLYLAEGCEGIIAFGGGSPMDCAKAIGARAKNPRQSVSDMRGMFKVKKATPPFFAVPTTAGTGSETTIAAVITDPETHEKYAITSFKLVPDVAILDPELMVGLPPHITSTTGMDALTHAVEAYIGLHGNSFTNDMAEKAVNLIFENLEDVYKDGSNLDKRNNMALASYYGGSAFTRCSVGYVHAIAHNMGGLYGVPHGLANAIILPYILDYSRKEAEGKLARLAVAGGIGKVDESPEVLSKRFIEKVKSMNANMDIPTTITELQEKDIPLIAKRALSEGNPNYPVPRIINQKECEEIVRKLLP